MSNEKGVPEFLSADNYVPSQDNSIPKYRSLDIKSQSHENHALKFDSVSKGKDSLTIPTNSIFIKNVEINSKSDNVAIISCPERPFALMRTHFVLDSAKMEGSKGESTSSKILEAVNTCLNDFSEYDFSYFPPECMWKGKYLQGSSCCEIHIHVYSDSSSASQPNYIVEANRVEGDSKPFFAFYKEFKAFITNTADSKPNNNFFFEPLPSSKTSKEQFLSGILPIFNMAAEPFFESRLEGAKMLCDLALYPLREYLQLPECRDKCIESLQILVMDDFDQVRQHSFCALAALVEIPGYCEELVKSSVIATVFQFVEHL